MMRRVDIACTESQRSTEATGTSGGIDSLAEGRVHGACVVSYSCTGISSALRGRLGGTKSVPRREVAFCRCAQKELHTARISCASWVPTVICSSQALSAASVCVVRLRNVLCGKLLTRSWKLMASVSAILQNLVPNSERERRCCTAHRTREVPSVTH